MRILSITAQKPDSTGSGIYLRELVRVFQQQGHQQAVVAGVYREDPVELPAGTAFYPVCFKTPALPFPIVGMSDEMPYESSRYRDLTPSRREQWQTAFLAVIRRAVEALRPELVICHHLYLLTALVREQFPGLNIVGICHNTDIRQMIKTDLARAYIAGQCARLQRIFVPGPVQAGELKARYHLDGKNFTLVNPGFNGEIFRPAAAKRSSPPYRLLYAGKIAAKKGVESLLRALRYLPYAPSELVVRLAGGAGDQAELAAIKALAAAAPYPVHFLGRLRQEQLAAEYCRSDVFVLPSFYDSLPLVVLEALACRTPVVVSDLPGVADWLAAELPQAPVRYVPLPVRSTADEICSAALTVFEQALARAITASLAEKEPYFPELKHLSWTATADRILADSKKNMQ